MARGATVTIRVRRKGFGDGVLLFEDLAIDVAPGRTLALLGPSGVGKSTLLRMVGGLEPFEGEILVDGEPAERGPVPGFVFQDPRLLPWLDALGNLRATTPTLSPMAAAAILARVGLAGSERKRPAELSGGMQRRVALARALAVGSGLLLLDEPFVSLDRTLARELQDLLAEVVAGSGATAILVTHDAEDAARLADRVVALTGRPARIGLDRTFDVPPAARDANQRRALVEELEAA